MNKTESTIDMKQGWAISTFMIYLDYVNPDMASTLIYKVSFLEEFLDEIIKEHKVIFFTKDRDEVMEKKYFIAVQDVRDWIKRIKKEK